MAPFASPHPSQWGRVVVAGLGISGRAAATALLDRGARVLVVDARAGDRERAAAEQLRAAGAEVRLGDAESPVDTDLIVTSPGWRPDQPLLAAALRAGIEVIGEPELAWRLRPEGAADWLGVTGTNGKTTTVGMLAAILRSAGHRTIAAGNVGVPLVEAVLAEPAYDVIAVELSSFQLHWSSALACRAAAVLNIADDHLDWHGSFADYAAAKTRIWSQGSVAVGNADDAEVTARLPAGGRLFSTTAGDADYVVRDGDLLERGSGVVLAGVGDLPLPGPHNVANALAAAALARTREVPAEAVAAGLRAYRPADHRGQVVGEHHGATYVDDSKATNPHAADASLAAYDSVVWIAGGLFKGADLDDLVRAHRHRLRAVVLLGRERARLAEALARHAPQIPVAEVADAETKGMGTRAMASAVALAAELAVAGDTVLLAPAAASWDMFRDYAERGDLFAAAARSLGRAG